MRDLRFAAFANHHGGIVIVQRYKKDSQICTFNSCNMSTLHVYTRAKEL